MELALICVINQLTGELAANVSQSNNKKHVLLKYDLLSCLHTRIKSLTRDNACVILTLKLRHNNHLMG